MNVKVSTSLRQEVFQKYGIVNAQASDYEIHYLIAPGLGGVEDIHKLLAGALHLPEVECVKKDALEEHLHRLVRAGELDLSTRSDDIATDWIAADKKYFYTDRRLSLYSRLESVPLLRFPGANTEPSEHYDNVIESRPAAAVSIAIAAAPAEASALAVGSIRVR